MKFVQLGHSHFKNEEAFIRGCLLFNIEYEKVNNITDISGSPDLIWSISTWFDPSKFPDSKIMFGPQFFIFPSEEGPLAKYSGPAVSRCVYNCLSDWNLKIHQDFTANPAIPYVCLPFGIDTSHIRPDKLIKKNYILVYWKQRALEDLDTVLESLKANNMDYKLIKYGSYDNKDFYTMLQECRLCIWIGRHESQGFAFQEALAMDVPLLVYDVISMKQEINSRGLSEYVGHTNDLLATAASYWDSRCGEKTTNPNEINALLKKMLLNLDSYRPREFIEDTLSDLVCFSRLLKVFGFT
jgi:glycosyltransferase involved in cell wall biosynthesis